MDKKEIGRKIKELRTRDQMSQLELAEIFQFKGYIQVSRWENSSQLPSIEQIFILNDLFKYNLFNLLADEQPDYKEKYFVLLEEFRDLQKSISSTGNSMKTQGSASSQDVRNNLMASSRLVPESKSAGKRKVSGRGKSGDAHK